MAPRKTLNQAEIAALGAERLAALLVELAGGDAAIKRRLKLELAGAAGGDRIVDDIRKRITTLAKGRSWIDWHKMKAFVQDIEAQRRAIMSHVAPDRPLEAFDLLWLMLDLAPAFYERCDDSNGDVSGIIRQVQEDLGEVTRKARPLPALLADRVFRGVCANDYGQCDGLIAMMAEPLGKEGLADLRARFEALAITPPQHMGDGEHRVVGYSSRGSLFEDDLAIDRHARLVRSALMEIADARQDVDGYMACVSPTEKDNPAFSARMAERLLGAGRIEEALATLEKARARRQQGGYWPDWDRVYVETLEAAGRRDEAEEQAMAFAGGHSDVHQGLGFLAAWPAPLMAADMIMRRFRELDGDHYELLTLAADLCETKQPLAATLALRSMIDFALDRARTKRYPHALRHLQTCANLAKRIADFGEHPDHEAYVARLRHKHGRKSGFWGA